MNQALVGIVLAAGVALVAKRAGALTRGGALAAFAVGAVVFGAAGWRGALVLFAFFVPSALLSRLGQKRKSRLAEIGKHGARDARQVLANGGIAALCALIAARNGVFAAAFAGAFAAAAGDTWGTEIGTLSSRAPRSIVTMRPVETGLSGGVTLLGSVATVAGAALVAVVGALAGVATFLPVVAGGAAGAIADSLLGATLQAQRWCPRCERACESNPHRCGTATLQRHGARWLDNDAVNFAATLTGAIVAGALALFLRRAH